MKIWMIGDGEVLHLRNAGRKGGTLDLRNTSRERPVEVPYALGSKIVLKGIINGAMSDAEMKARIPADVRSPQELIEKGLAEGPAAVKKVKKVEPTIEPETPESTPEEVSEKPWEDKTYNEKKSFSKANGYEGKSLKEVSLDEWYKSFVKNNEI